MPLLTSSQLAGANRTRQLGVFIDDNLVQWVRISKHAASTLAATVAFLGNAAPSHAQDTEVGGGISWVWIQDDHARWNTYQGWSLEVARSLTPHWGIAGEVNGNYDSIDYSNGWSESHRIFTFVGGPRLRTSGNDRVLGFAHLLIGIGRTSDTLRTPPDPDLNVSSSGFVMEPGGGMDVKVARRVDVRSRISVGVADPWHSISWHFPLWRIGVSGVYKWWP